jgi:hypothetical protein
MTLAARHSLVIGVGKELINPGGGDRTNRAVETPASQAFIFSRKCLQPWPLSPTMSG